MTFNGGHHLQKLTSRLWEGGGGRKTLHKVQQALTSPQPQPATMSDNESISHTSAAEEINVHDIITQIRDHHKRADELLKQTEKMLKKVKVKTPKSAADRKPRKASEGQKRWRAFQSYIWELLKADNPTTPYKEAMRVAGERKREGYLADGSKTLAKFETWLKANPIPSDEERAAAKAKKDAAAKAAREAKKNAKKTAAKKQSASAAKAAEAAETDAGTTDAEPAAAAKPATAKPAAKGKKSAAAATDATSASEAEPPSTPAKTKKAPAAAAAPKKAAAAAASKK